MTPENIRNLGRKIAPRHYFHLNRLKATYPRTAVLKFLQASRGPVSAGDIKANLPDINASTLYGTLKILIKADIIEPVEQPPEIIERNRVFKIYGKKAPRKRAYYQFK